jgi:hypothetical protein
VGEGIVDSGVTEELLEVMLVVILLDGFVGNTDSSGVTGFGGTEQEHSPIDSGKLSSAWHHLVA